MAKNRRTSPADDDDLVTTTDRFPSAESRARWLFDFLRTDLAKTTEGQVLGLRKDALGFAGAVIVQLPDSGPTRAPSRDKAADRWEQEQGHVVPAEELPRLQASIRSGFNRLREHRWWLLEGPISYGIATLGGRIIRGHRQGAFRDLFLAAALDLVQEWWDRLYTCERCKAIFVKIGKQAYCSPTCSQKARMERFRSKRPPRNYLAEREQAARKRFGPNVRLRRRGVAQPSK
jgi:hypothetical protein